VLVGENNNNNNNKENMPALVVSTSLCPLRSNLGPYEHLSL